MSIKSVALALNELDKVIAECHDPSLKAALDRHIQHMTKLLMNERILSNQARNFKLQASTEIPLSINSHIGKNNAR